jgi:hypothetical protein
MLKNSARNCPLKRSPNVQVLKIQKSQSRKPESRNRFRRIVPDVPKAGGTMTDFPFPQQPKSFNVTNEGASAKHAAWAADVSATERGTGPTAFPEG